MTRMASDVAAAEAATASVQALTIDDKKTVDFGPSNIAGMHVGREIANELLEDFGALVSCVKTQAAKFPALANVREGLDEADKKLFKKE
jgi:hypothetical protein